ncbi:MAG: phage tail protein [Desulfobacterales bacterium]|nr:phage tail protein [Desulfobacterales bacterium]
MSKISVSINQSDLNAVRLLLNGLQNSVPKVLCRAINKTLSGVQTDAVSEIADELNLTKTRIRKDFKISRASLSNTSGKVVSKGKPVGLASFIGTRQTKTGVSVKVKKQGKRSVLKHAFIAKAKTAENVWWRKYSGTRKQFRPNFKYAKLPKKYKLPIQRLTGPRIQDIFAKDKVIKKVETKAKVRLDKNFAHEIDYELQRNR